MLISLPAHTLPNLIFVHETTIVLHSLDTFTLTMGSIVLLVIMVPKVRTELTTQGSRWVQGVSQNDFTTSSNYAWCSSENMMHVGNMEC